MDWSVLVNWHLQGGEWHLQRGTERNQENSPWKCFLTLRSQSGVKLNEGKTVFQKKKKKLTKLILSDILFPILENNTTYFSCSWENVTPKMRKCLPWPVLGDVRPRCWIPPLWFLTFKTFLSIWASKEPCKQNHFITFYPSSLSGNTISYLVVLTPG